VTRLALVLLAGLTAGCAGVTSQTRLPAGTTSLAALTAWVATGRLAVAAAGEGGSGGFVWQQQGPETRLNLQGPLGTGTLEIASDGERLSVTDARGELLGPDARAALRDRLGAELPLASFRYWMIGLPDPAAEAHVTQSDSPPLRTIEQLGWTVAYEAFAPAGELQLPARVTATSGALRVRVTVRDWQLDPENGSEPISTDRNPQP
jgi:outer membrane lipoprotein LolB